MPIILSFRLYCAAVFVLVFSFLGLSAVNAQEKAVPNSKQQVQLSYAPVVRQVSPSVVNVYGTRVEQRQAMQMDDFFRRFFGNGGPNMPRERVQRSLGSGVIVDSDGLVVTNNHVIEGMTTVKVALADRREYDAEIILRDPKADLAVLKIDGAKDLHAITFGDSEALEVGDILIAIGNPFGVGQTVTQGIVSALARTQVGVSDYQFFIQTDAAINPGNSGGGLINMNGELVGINTAIYSRTGGSVGIGFAIPSTMVKAVVQAARSGQKRIKRPWFGAKLQVVTAEVAEAMGLDRPMGALIVSFAANSPAEQADLKRGDVIIAVADYPIEDMEAFGYRFSLKGIGGDVQITIQRGKERLKKNVKLAPAPEIPLRQAIELKGRSPLAGAIVANLSPAVAEELDMQLASEGVVLLDLRDDSTAKRVGFQKGDIIVAINRAVMKEPKDIENTLSQPARAWEFVVNRAGQEFVTVLR